MGRLVCAVLCLLVLATPVAAATKAMKGVALVIGQTNYVWLDPLANPDRDARDIDHMLDELGFDVTRVLDVRTEQLREKIDDFVSDAEGADVALVYYSGHGIEAGGANYIMGTDAEIGTPEAASATLFEVDGLLDRLEATVPITIMLLDACRTNPFDGAHTLQRGSGAAVEIRQAGLDLVRGPDPVEAEVVDSLGMVIGFSASPGQSALDGPPGGNSPYASALLQHLSAGGFSFGDIMTLVSNEVYVATGARQRPWTNSSLSRILYFGRDVEAEDGDEAEILGERRKLLLNIATVPEESKAFIEAVATQENLRLADLYSMLDIINAGKDGANGQDREALLGVAGRVREVLDDPILSGTPTDPELARLDALATKAIEAGAFKKAFKYRQEQAKVAAKIEKGLDAQQADIDERRRELATVYARVAEAAMYTLNDEAEADAITKATAQTDLFDKSLSIKLRLRAANALADRANERMSERDGLRAIALYKGIIEDIDKTADLPLWVDVQLRMGWTMFGTANRREDKALHDETEEVARTLVASIGTEADARTWRRSHLLLAEALRHNDGSAEALPLLLEIAASTSAAASPVDWALVHESIGEILYWEGRTQTDTETEKLRAAAEAYGEAAETRGVERWYTLAMRARKSEVESYFAIRTDDRAILDEALADGRQSLNEVGEKNQQQWGNQASWLGRNMVVAGLHFEDTELLDEALSLMAKAEKILTRKTGLADWSQMREADGDALAYLGNIEPRSTKKLRAAIKAYDDAVGAIEDMGHMDFDRPKLKRIKLQIALGDKVSAKDRALASLPEPAAIDVSGARLQFQGPYVEPLFEGYETALTFAKVDGKLTPFQVFVMTDWTSETHTPDNLNLLRISIYKRQFKDPESKEADFEDCGPLATAGDDQVLLHYGKESYLNGCVLAGMGETDAAKWYGFYRQFPQVIADAAAAGDKNAARILTLLAVKPLS